MAENGEFQAPITPIQVRALAFTVDTLTAIARSGENHAKTCKERYKLAVEMARSWYWSSRPHLLEIAPDVFRAKGEPSPVPGADQLAGVLQFGSDADPATEFGSAAAPKTTGRDVFLKIRCVDHPELRPGGPRPGEHCYSVVLNTLGNLPIRVEMGERGWRALVGVICDMIRAEQAEAEQALRAPPSPE